jgi:hypothetical protein
MLASPIKVLYKSLIRHAPALALRLPYNLPVTAFSLWSESSRDFEFQPNQSTFLGLPRRLLDGGAWACLAIIRDRGVGVGSLSLGAV